ncbi:MAG: beta-lactamase-like protein [Gammaproteobacteria bacterium]|nr:MAG: beta-lactamase-like protein [Gammaproteobacteria bacterium]TND02221.1 MAG: beta-lactamase-like protein [Gammaproteobacteria bacterium]
MIFHQIRSGNCLSYLIGCEETRTAIVVDPESSQIDRYLSLASRDGLLIHFVFDTHTHADHFSGSKQLATHIGARVIMHRAAAAPFIDMPVDDGETLIVGKLRARVMHTPGHTSDSTCMVFGDRILTGDTLLIGGTGRTDLPSGDPYQLYDSLFHGILLLEPALEVFPAHDYKGRTNSTLRDEIENNPRLQSRDRNTFVEQMRAQDLGMPVHLTEALRVNRSGGKSVASLIADASGRIAFMAMEEVLRLGDAHDSDIVVLDVREHEAYRAGHIPGAINIPRGQLELRVDDLLPDPTRRIVACCEYGKISTLAAATLKDMGFGRAVALDGGIQAWKRAGYPFVCGP